MKGKAKIEFEKWLIENESIQDLKNKDELMHHWLSFKGFENLPESMQWGVIQDWFDSVDYVIAINRGFGFYSASVGLRELRFDKVQEINTEYHAPKYFGNKFKSRPEARVLAIAKAVEIYNER